MRPKPIDSYPFNIKGEIDLTQEVGEHLSMGAMHRDGYMMTLIRLQMRTNKWLSLIAGNQDDVAQELHQRHRP